LFAVRETSAGSVFAERESVTGFPAAFSGVVIAGAGMDGVAAIGSLVIAGVGEADPAGGAIFAESSRTYERESPIASAKLAIIPSAATRNPLRVWNGRCRAARLSVEVRCGSSWRFGLATTGRLWLIRVRARGYFSPSASSCSTISTIVGRLVRSFSSSRATNC